MKLFKFPFISSSLIWQIRILFLYPPPHLGLLGTCLVHRAPGHDRQVGPGGGGVGWGGPAVLPSQLPWEDLSCMELDRTLEDDLPTSVGAQYATGNQWRNNSRKNEEMEPGQKQYPVVDVTGDRSNVRGCKEQYCIGTWNVRSMIKANWKWSNRRWQE